MTAAELRALPEKEAERVPPWLRAMWWDAHGNWYSAHALAQDEPGREGAWVHAYLHRKEGDEGNAGYWYRQAGVKAFRGTLDEEWMSLTEELLRR